MCRPIYKSVPSKQTNLVTRSQILRLKCTDSILARALPQTPMIELIQYAPDFLAGLRGLTSKERERKGRRLFSSENSLEYALHPYVGGTPFLPHFTHSFIHSSYFCFFAGPSLLVFVMAVFVGANS